MKILKVLKLIIFWIVSLIGIIILTFSFYVLIGEPTIIYVLGSDSIEYFWI